MNTYFATVEGFGRLDYQKIYGFYDEPLMFTCQSQNGSKILLLRLADNQAKWLATEVTDACLNRLEAGSLEMREPFIHPENGFSYIISCAAEPYPVNLISPASITDEMLPYAGEYLTDTGETVQTATVSVNEQTFTTIRERLKWDSMLGLTNQAGNGDFSMVLSVNQIESTVSRNKANNQTGASFSPDTEGDEAA